MSFLKWLAESGLEEIVKRQSLPRATKDMALRRAILAHALKEWDTQKNKKKRKDLLSIKKRLNQYPEDRIEGL